jgi:hypothetical protein
MASNASAQYLDHGCCGATDNPQNEKEMRMTLPANDVPATHDELTELPVEALEAVVGGTGTPSPEPLLPPHFPLPIPLPA